MTSWIDARRFLLANARLLERRRHLGDADGVRHAVLGHRNPDGGFGHAIEPDVRAPDSQPLGCETALAALLAAGIRDAEVAARACDFAATVADPGGGVPILLPSIAGHPRASHWEQEVYEPDVNPTASLAGYAHAHGATHPWLDDATAWCFARLEQGPPAEAHAVKCALVFLEHVPDRDRAERLAPAMVEGLAASAWFRSDPDDPGYGVTPLDVVPRPDHPWRRLFEGDVLDAHLDRLARDQQDDGGWPITWDAPGQASITEWRGIVTLHAVDALVAYGRLTPEG